MVMTRGSKRKAQEEEEAAAIVVDHLYRQLSLTTKSPSSSSHLPFQGADGKTPANVSPEMNPLNSQSEKMSSFLTTKAVAKVDNQPLQVDPVVKPCSVATSGKVSNQYYRQVSCKRNPSTAAVGAIKKGVHDYQVADEIQMGTPLSQIHCSLEATHPASAATVANREGVKDFNVADGVQKGTPLFEIHRSPSVTQGQPVDRTECYKSLSTTPFLQEDFSDKLMPNEHKSLQEAVTPVEKDRSNSMGETCSNGKQASSFNLSAIDSLDDDGSSICSELSSAAVKVGGYRVKEDLASILRHIILKYGDIASQCCKKSIMLRSLLIENVCDIVHKLHAAEFVHITPVELDSYRIFVEDLASDGVEVGWLLQRLNEISEAKKLLKGSSKVKQDIRENRQAIKLKEEELKMMKTEERKLNEILSYTKAQVKRFHRGSMIDGLL